MVAISPQGTHIVYNANYSLWLRPVGQLQATRLAGTEDARGPFFSADGESIGFWVRGQLKKVSLSGGVPVTLSEIPAIGWGASWGADDMILYDQPEGIMRVPGQGGATEVLIPLQDGERAHGPQMLPGGNWVLFTVRSAGVASWDEAQVVVQSVATGERTVLIDGARDGRYLRTGHLVYLLNNALFAVPFDLDSRDVRGGAVPLIEGVRRADVGGGAAQFSVSDNGSLVYIPGLGGVDGYAAWLTWVGRNGNEELIPIPPRAYAYSRVSPAGTRVALNIRQQEDLNVWIWDLERETLSQLTFEGSNRFPMWTPDGSRVVFESNRDGGGLFWKAADGTGQVERLLEHSGRIFPLSWSADGGLVFEQAPGDIGVLPMEGERTIRMLLSTESDEGDPAVSPNGRWVAYTLTEPGEPPAVHVRSFASVDDGQWRVSSGSQPTWSPDGSELFYIEAPNLMVAQISETETGFNFATPGALLDISSYVITGQRRNYDISPDGEQILTMKYAPAPTSEDDPFAGLILVQNWFQELTERVPTGQ